MAPSRRRVDGVEVGRPRGRPLPGFGVGSLSKIFFFVSEIFSVTFFGSKESMDPSCDALSSSLNVPKLQCTSA